MVRADTEGIKMTMLVGLILVALSVCSAELEPKCAWGQSYWCSALDAAKSCGAIDHCKTTVWKNQLLKQDDGDSCLFCKTIVGDVKTYIKQGKTEEEISQFLASACAIIPDSSSAAKCKKISEEMIKDVLQLVTSDVDVRMVCSLLSVCGGLEDTVMHAPIIKPAEALLPAKSVDRKLILTPLHGTVLAEPICDDCKKFFNDVKDMITSNKTEAEIEQMINEELCAQLGSLENECKALVHQFLPEVLKMISSYYDPDLICKSIGVCPATGGEVKYQLLFTRLRKLSLYKASMEKNSASTCLICKSILTELQMIGKDPAIQREIKDLIKTQICSRLISLKEVCEMVVNEYSTELFAHLASILEPSTRCHSLGFCDAAGDADAIKMLPLTPLKPADKVAAIPENDPPQCMLCEFIVTELKQMLKDNATEEQIIHALEKVCSYMPDKYTAQCKQFVDDYGRMVIDLLIQSADPETVCKQIGLCPTNGVDNSIPISKVIPTSKDDPQCVLCEYIVRQLKQMIATNATEEQIIAALEKVCTYLPDTYAKECKDFVETYGRMAIELLISELTPEMVCQQLGLCPTAAQSLAPGKALPPIRVSYPTVGSSEACVVCETIIQYLEALLEQGSTMEQIEALMSKLCGYLPEKFTTQCENLVKLYGDLIIHYVSTMAPPREVCKLMGVCEDKLSAAGISGVNRAARSVPQIELEQGHPIKPEIRQKAKKLGEGDCAGSPKSICLHSPDLVKTCKLEEFCQKNVWNKEEP